MTHQLTADEKTSQPYFDRLNEYMQSNVLTKDDKFICKNEKKCRESCVGEERELYTGQLHHVGPLYDLKRNGKPFRIVVSGAEYGGADKEPSSLEKRTNDITNLDPKNQHMNGTLCLLQMLFGEEPDNEKLKFKVNGDEEVNIFSAFSQVNFLLCSAVPKGDDFASGAFTDVTRNLCRDHYQKMLEILQPQIVILQGTRAQDFFNEHYDLSLNYSEPKIETIKVGGKPMLILPLYHPSYQKKAWGGVGYAATGNYVKPAVERLLAEYEKTDF